MSCGLHMAEQLSSAIIVIFAYCIRCWLLGYRIGISNIIMLLFTSILTPGFLYLYTGPSIHTLGNYFDP